MARCVDTSPHSALPEIGLENLIFVGKGLNRPECILSTVRGDLFAADWRGGVALPNGEQRLYRGLAPDGRELRRNGISLQARHTAHLGCLRLPFAGHPLPHWNYH